MANEIEGASGAFISGATIQRDRKEAEIKNTAIHDFAGKLLDRYGHEETLPHNIGLSNKIRKTPDIILSIDNQDHLLGLGEYTGSFGIKVRSLTITQRGKNPQRTKFEMRGNYWGTLLGEETRLQNQELDQLQTILEQMEALLQIATGDGQLSFSSRTM